MKVGSTRAEGTDWGMYKDWEQCGPLQLGVVRWGLGKKDRHAREGKKERIDQELRVAGGRMNSDSEIQRCK